MLRKTFVGLAAGALVSLASVNANAADIVDTAVKAGQFNTLAAALKAGDLIVVLKGTGLSRSSRRPTKRSRSFPPERSKTC